MEKPIFLPEKPKVKNTPTVPEFVRNVMGSSAGAGSGEFHVYRHLRRKEYSRQKFIQEKGKKELLDEEYHKKLEENKKKAEEATMKRRARRLKKKQKSKRSRRVESNGNSIARQEDQNNSSKSNDDSCSDDGEQNIKNENMRVTKHVSMEDVSKAKENDIYGENNKTMQEILNMNDGDLKYDPNNA